MRACHCFSSRFTLGALAGLFAGSLGCTSLLGDDYFLDTAAGAGGDGAAGGGAASGGGGGGGGAKPKPDLSKAVWDLENASNTPATISHDGVLVIANGRRWAAWSEPDDEDLSEQAVWANQRDDGGGWSGGQVTDFAGEQVADPDIAAFGDTVYVAFSRDVDGFDDIYVARHQGDAWLQPADITASTKRPMTRNDYEPSLAVSRDGKLALAYLSYLPNDFSDAQVRVVRFDDDGVAQAPELNVASGSCEAPDALFDDAGNLWVVADCGDGTADAIVLATDRSGSWQSQTIDGPGSGFLADPHLALDPNGKEVHVAWSGDAECIPDETDCNDIFYVRTEDGVVTGPGQNLTSTGDVREAESSIAVDAHGRPIIVFHRFDDPDARIYFVWGDDGVFAEQKLITPSAGADQWFPTSTTVDPLTQLPEFVYERRIPATRPVNTEIFRGAMRPTTSD
ncbi:MAG: hypothetical protein WKG00_09190 [Polyangiaceae bacterium]